MDLTALTNALDAAPPAAVEVDFTAAQKAALNWVRDNLSDVPDKFRRNNWACVLALLADNNLLEKYVPDPVLRDRFTETMSAVHSSLNTVLAVRPATATPYVRLYNTMRGL